MVFFLNVIFISAACVFALSNSWSVSSSFTTLSPSPTDSSSGAAPASVVPDSNISLNNSPFFGRVAHYNGGDGEVVVPRDAHGSNLLLFLSNENQSPTPPPQLATNSSQVHLISSNKRRPSSSLSTNKTSPDPPVTQIPQISPPPSPEEGHEAGVSASSADVSAKKHDGSRRLAAEGGAAQTDTGQSEAAGSDSSGAHSFLRGNVDSGDGRRRGSSFWLVSDTVELFFYVVILHHNTGLLFQNCILVDILLLSTCLTFILTATMSTPSTIG